MNKFQKVASKLAKLDNMDVSNGQSKNYYREAKNEHISIFKFEKWTFKEVLDYKARYNKMTL